MRDLGRASAYVDETHEVLVDAHQDVDALIGLKRAGEKAKLVSDKQMSLFLETAS